MAGSVVRFPNMQPIDPPEKPKREKKRPKNSMPDGRRRVRLDVGVDPETGERIRIPFYGKSLTEAKDARDAYKLAHGLIKGQAALVAPLPALVPPPSLTVEDWVDTWLETYGQNAGYSMNTTTRINCKKLTAFFGKMLLADVREADAQQFANSVAHYKKSTVDKIRITTNGVFKRALSNQRIELNPCEGVRWEHSGEGTHRCLEQWEIQHISANWSAHHAGIWVMLMLYAGLRRGEALGLLWKYIDLDAGVIRVRHAIHFEVNEPKLGPPKTRKSVRDIPIFPPLRAMLEALPLPQPSGFVCTDADYCQVTLSAYNAGWDAFNHTMANILNGDTKEAVAPGRRSDLDEKHGPRKEFSLRSHDLRHTFASMLYDAGVDVKTAQYLLGHETLEMTLQIYTHLSESRRTSSVDKMVEFTQKYAQKSDPGFKWGSTPPATPVK